MLPYTISSVTTGKLLITDKKCLLYVPSQHEGLVDLSWLPRKKPKTYSLAVIRTYPIITYDIMDMRTKQRDGKYKHTVDLPKTTFGMRANSSVREPELHKLWDENQVRHEPLSDVPVGVLKFLWNLVICSLEEPEHHDLYYPNIIVEILSTLEDALIDELKMYHIPEIICLKERRKYGLAFHL
ncbi:hypothetical protein Tco_0270168 [Tanacetum coccineum]